MVTHKLRSPRYISDANTLEKYGASIIRDEEDQPIGIEIAGWSITTSSSSIGNEGQMEELTSKIEETVEGTRRIILPEIVFVNAFVSAKYKQNPSELAGSSSSSSSSCFKSLSLSSSSSSSSSLSSPCTMEIRFSAEDALMEWASCHNHLPPAMDNSAMVATDCGPASESYKGISIIKTVDAKLWEERQAKEQKRKQMVLVGDKKNERTTGISDPIEGGENTFVGGGFLDNTRTSCSTEFNYDWTYSTPYTGTIVLLESEESKHKDASSLSWNEMETSGLDMELLSDQTQPILYFDDVHLYEDDMHDNGYVSLRCKIRVMPTCFFILLSLFVRVDHVLIRVKEVRFFSKFSCRGVVCDNVVLEETEQQEGSRRCSSSSSSSNNRHDAGHAVRIFRDVTWRECSWDALDANGLSSHIGSWRIEDDSSQQQRQQQQQQRIQGMIRMLPQVQLPMDICRHCSFQGS